MPKSPIPFHVQHIARPAHIERILVTVSNDQVFAFESMRLQLTQEEYDTIRFSCQGVNLIANESQVVSQPTADK